MKAIVIGGTGFLGLSIIEALQAGGHEVVATRRSSSNTIFLRRLKVPMKTVSFDDKDSLVSAMEGCDAAFFAAGHYPRLSIDTAGQVARGVAMLRNVIAASRRAKVQRFLYTGSVVTVARPKQARPAVESDGMPEQAPEGSTYIAVKLALEREMMAAIKDGLPGIILLPAGCLGPCDHKIGTSFFIVSLAHRALPVFVDGDVNVVDARDAALGHVAAALKGRVGQRYLLGGTNLRVSAMVKQVAEKLRVPLPGRCLLPGEAIRFAGEEEARCNGTPQRPLITREMVDLSVFGQYVDSSKASREFGFAARPLSATLNDAIAWYRKNGYIPKAS
jgi:dihydroflavonol-4-reductase